MADKTGDLNTQILIDIRQELANINTRVDNYLFLAGEAAREHEAWLRDHEVRIKRLERHPPRRRPTSLLVDVDGNNPAIAADDTRCAELTRARPAVVKPALC